MEVFVRVMRQLPNPILEVPAMMASTGVLHSDTEERSERTANRIPTPAV